MMYKISGVVVHGEKRARKLGYPTANVNYDGDLLPGVYAINIEFHSIIYLGIGVLLEGKNVFEAHLFDQDIDLYGKNIDVYVLSFIRNNEDFISSHHLKNRISQDVVQIRSSRYPALTFGSFDLVHKGHGYYLQEARKFGTELITIVASDENIRKIKGFDPKYSQTERVSHIVDLGVSDQVICGSQNTPLQWIDTFQPTSICLGYDQRGPFVDMLEEYLDKRNLHSHIVRIAAFKPETFKSSILKEKE